MSAPAPEQLAPWYVRRGQLISAVVAVAGFFAGVTGNIMMHRATIAAYSSRLAPLTFTEKWKGEVGPRALLQRADVLPLYGSSELIVEMPNRAADFFADAPTGFAVAPLGDRAYPVLSMALGVGSLGDALRGKRVAVSLSGTWFIGDDTLNDPKIFRNHYSELQTGDLLFFSGLPRDLRRRFAARIMDYDLVTADFPLLNPALGCLARSCALEPLIPALAPIWATRSLFLHAKDYRRVAGYSRQARPPVHRPASIDWSALEAHADSQWRVASASNSFGIQDSLWHNEYEQNIAAGAHTESDTGFVVGMRRATRWKDLELLLASLKALGARPLILDSPLKGVWWDYRGVSRAARERFYQRFDSATSGYGFSVVTFADRDGDPRFLSESRSHLSSKGWVVYDKTLNAFFHDSLR